MLKFDRYKNKILHIGTKISFTDTQWEQLFSKPHWLCWEHLWKIPLPYFLWNFFQKIAFSIHSLEVSLSILILPAPTAQLWWWRAWLGQAISSPAWLWGDGGSMRGRAPCIWLPSMVTGKLLRNRKSGFPICPGSAALESNSETIQAVSKLTIPVNKMR